MYDNSNNNVNSDNAMLMRLCPLFIIQCFGMKGMILYGNMEQAIQANVYSPIGCVCCFASWGNLFMFMLKIMQSDCVDFFVDSTSPKYAIILCSGLTRLVQKSSSVWLESHYGSP